MDKSTIRIFYINNKLQDRHGFKSYVKAINLYHSLLEYSLRLNRKFLKIIYE